MYAHIHTWLDSIQLVVGANEQEYWDNGLHSEFFMVSILSCGITNNCAVQYSSLLSVFCAQDVCMHGLLHDSKLLYNSAAEIHHAPYVIKSFPYEHFKQCHLWMFVIIMTPVEVSATISCTLHQSMHNFLQLCRL